MKLTEKKQKKEFMAKRVQHETAKWQKNKHQENLSVIKFWQKFMSIVS